MPMSCGPRVRAASVISLQPCVYMNSDVWLNGKLLGYDYAVTSASPAVPIPSNAWPKSEMCTARHGALLPW